MAFTNTVRYEIIVVYCVTIVRVRSLGFRDPLLGVSIIGMWKLIRFEGFECGFHNIFCGFSVSQTSTPPLPPSPTPSCVILFNRLKKCCNFSFLISIIIIFHCPYLLGHAMPKLMFRQRDRDLQSLDIIALQGLDFFSILWDEALSFIKI